MSDTSATPVSVLIAAAGNGDRLGRGPKARLSLNGRWLAQWVFDVVRHISDDVIVAIPPDDDPAAWRERLPDAHIVAGGATRFASLGAAMAAARHPYLLLADAARPFITSQLISEVLSRAEADTVSAAATPIATPIITVQDDMVVDMRSNTRTFTMETPIALHRNCLAHALREAGDGEGHLSQVLARLGYRIRVTPCARGNIKITHRDDWPLAEAIAAHWPGPAGP